MFNVKLREAQRPVKLRDGVGGPMRIVTADEWVEFKGFRVLPDYIAQDNNFEIEEVASSPAPSTSAAPALIESPSAKPATPQPSRRRRRSPTKKPSAS